MSAPAPRYSKAFGSGRVRSWPQGGSPCETSLKAQRWPGCRPGRSECDVMMSGAQFANLIVHETATVRTAMECLNANAREVVFVQDQDGLISGLITDGDIRRRLLVGTRLESPVTEVMRRDYFAVSPEVDRA